MKEKTIDELYKILLTSDGKGVKIKKEAIEEIIRRTKELNG